MPHDVMPQPQLMMIEDGKKTSDMDDGGEEQTPHPFLFLSSSDISREAHLESIYGHHHNNHSGGRRQKSESRSNAGRGERKGGRQRRTGVN